ncbi:thiol:disulfide interchange protein DsbA/DsbL [Suttonella ornithocola]|uniref:Thiol:disulfide interchange protein n=1 Tax=Suttonella ornithocola TaxID=279832 RepID=A0A380MUC2_9GAMM|nr:thiol:disulfide interchange protein DsbA/DsbL [Suttonella ornithocola]SUO95862.1 Thiol:disulfide interchange protein DsbA precursor [Suttonella ornithocola]
MFKKFSWLGLVAATVLPFTVHAQMKYHEGSDYQVLETPIETTESPKVIEFFWFGCPHCNAIRPAVTEWLNSGKADNVAFEFIPADIDTSYWHLPAHAYYTMKTLNKDLFDAYFDEVFEHKNRGVLADESKIKEFFVKNGVEPDAFDKAWNSFEVKQQLQRANELFSKSGSDGVPVFVVNGKYIVQPRGDSKVAYDRAFDIINTLAK